MSSGTGEHKIRDMSFPVRMNSMRINSLSGDSSGKSLEYNLGLPLESGGSMKLSGRDLLDILTAFTSPGDAPRTPTEEQGQGFQDKSNTQHLAHDDLARADAFRADSQTFNASLGGSMKFQDLGRCEPVGGAYNQFYAPGYDDYGYSVPSPLNTVDPQVSQPIPTYSQAPPAAVQDPMSFDRILLSSKNTGLESKKEIKKRHTPPLKKNQAKTGYQHKPRKPHPVVEKARRDGINALIEDLRDIVPEGGWNPMKVKRSTSLKDALTKLHGEPGASTGNAQKPDKRTKRAVLMDAISSIESLEAHVNKLAEEVDNLIKGGEPSMRDASDAGTPSTMDGKIFEEEEMKKVHVEMEVKHKTSSQDVESNTMTLIVKVAYFDRRGFLADECVAMRSLELNIKHAELPKPNRNGFVQDVFEVEMEKISGQPEEEVDLDGLKGQLMEALAETQCLYYQSVKAGEKRARPS